MKLDRGSFLLLTASIAAEGCALVAGTNTKYRHKGPQGSTGGASEGSTEISLQIASVGNDMKYDKTTLTVTAGEHVLLQFHNNATSAVLPHNWVLVKPGTPAQVAACSESCAVTSPKLADCVAAGLQCAGANVLASTALALPGKTVDTSFTAPAAGQYPYICTVPGHYMSGHGTLVVEP